MKTIHTLSIISVACSFQLSAQNAGTTYTNFIRQVQLPSSVEADQTDETYVASSGQQESTLEINPGGARFELHTVSSDPFVSYLLDTRYVGAYVPQAEVTIRTEDVNSLVPRTRADRPFFVDVKIEGLRSGVDDPVSSKSVTFYHHVQSYGENGDGTNIDREQAILNTQSTISENGTEILTFALSAVPGANRAKVRGEERFSIFSLPDYQAPASQLATQFIQVWPVADGTLSGIADGQAIGFSPPTVTIAVNDIYPKARIYAQVYKGSKRDDGFMGTIVPGSAVVVNESVPQDRLLTVSDWDSIITENGTWTMELLTSTVFGIDRLDHVTFEVDRTMTINGTVTTIE
ncbi:MAG: hypothetical protein AB8D78_15480 [Akkermansiaceae bacterium]